MLPFSADYISDLDARIAELNAAIGASGKLITDVAAAQQHSHDWRADLDQSWVMITAYFTFLIIIGFALVEGGFTRRRNFQTAIFNNTLVAAVVALFWWFTGYGFTFGGGVKNKNGFIGNDNIFLSGETKFPVNKYDEVFFYFTITAVSTLIISGAVAERLSNIAFLVHGALYSGFIWPVIAHWLYSDAGFFSPWSTLPRLGKNGVIDTGFSAVHICGGAAALGALIIAGPRKGDSSFYVAGNNRVFQVVGTLIQFAGWFGITMGGVKMISDDASILTSRVAINITLAAGTSGVIAFFYKLFRHDEFNLTAVISGALAGLVSVSASCAVIEPWAAFVIGIIGSFIYIIFRRVIANSFDDAVSAVAVHLFCGIWSILTVGIFATHVNTVQVLGHDTVAYGFLYGGSGNQFAVQLFAAILMILWTLIITIAWSAVLNAIGLLNVGEVEPEKETKSD